MDTSNWINFFLLIVAIIAAGASWRAVFAARNSAREANDIQNRLLDVENQRDILEVTPNISASRVNLHDTGRLLSTEISLTNLSRQAIHILAVAVFDSTGNELLALGRQNRAVQSGEGIDVDFGAEPLPIVRADQQGSTTTTQQLTVDLLARADKIKLYFRYAATGNSIHSATYVEAKHEPLTKGFYLKHNRRVPFDPIEKNISMNEVIPQMEY